MVAGTRITVELILEELGHGQPIDNPFTSYPALTYEGVLAALEYAAKVLRLDAVDPDGSLLSGAGVPGRRERRDGNCQLGPRDRPFRRRQLLKCPESAAPSTRTPPNQTEPFVEGQHGARNLWGRAKKSLQPPDAFVSFSQPADADAMAGLHARRTSQVHDQI